MPIEEQTVLRAAPEPSVLTEPASAASSKTETIDCDLIAPWYEPVEHLCFGRALERRRNAFIANLGDVRTALSCGEGDGRFSAALLRENARVEVTAVDASYRMTQVAARRVTKWGPELPRRAEYQCSDIHAFQPPRPSYDLIATHFFLDCFSTEEASAVIQRIAGWASSRSRWIVSEFTQSPTGLGHLWTGAIIRSLYAAFRMTTGLRVTHLPDYGPALQREGFELRRQEYALAGLLVSEMWERN